MTKRARLLTALVAAVLLLASGLAAVLPRSVGRADVTTVGNDPLRTSWYSDLNGLSRDDVTASDFGRIFATKLTGQIYAQPIVARDTVLVATEANNIYGLDPTTGAVRWSRFLGTPWNSADVGCPDLTPTIGITSTPVVDPATGIAYLMAKKYVSGTSGPGAYWMHAVDVTTGAEQAGFPVQVPTDRPADNDPTRRFDATRELQRTGLLLLDGVIYAGYGGMCDFGPYSGWVSGISTQGTVRSLWSATFGAGTSGAGIWQSGGGLVSDGPGRIFLSTGNGADAPLGVGTAAPANASFGQAVVRLDVQPDGRLRAGDYFAPYDADRLDTFDADFGSAGPAALPAGFGPPGTPPLLVQAGKAGYVYLLNRNDLGGRGQAVDGGDRVVARVGQHGGVWSRPAVWPGDGGWIYMPTASGGTTAGGSFGVLHAYKFGADGDGKPTLALTASDREGFGFSSGAPAVTSDGTRAGSAIVWIVFAPNGTGAGAELRAYDAVPVNGTMHKIFEAPIGTAAKFSAPAFADNRVFVGNRDGTVVAFGRPAAQSIHGTRVVFPATTVGANAKGEARLDVVSPVTVTGLAIADDQFAIDDPQPVLPQSHVAGDQLVVPLEFHPKRAGAAGATLVVTTTDGTVSVGLAGDGRASGPLLQVSPPAVSFGGHPAGGQAADGNVTITNAGAAPLTITNLTRPTSPFSVSGLPAVGATLAPGKTVTATVSFAPEVIGDYGDELVIETDGGTEEIGLSGRVTLPPHLEITPSTAEFGQVDVGTMAVRTLTLENTGGSPLTLFKSKPPGRGVGFSAGAGVDEGRVLQPGERVTATVRFAPAHPGPATDQWVISGDDALGLHTIPVTGVAVDPDPVPALTDSGWQRNGVAAVDGADVVLTPATARTAGSTFWPAPVPSERLSVAFDAKIGGGNGADGLTLLLADPSRGASPYSLGAEGGGLGAAGVPGTLVALDTYRNEADPATGFVGIGTTGPPGIRWTATATDVGALRGGTRRVRVTVLDSTLSVSLDGTEVLHADVNLPSDVLLGFTAATGGLADEHRISHLVVEHAKALPLPGAFAPAGSPVWKLSGSARQLGGALELTRGAGFEAGAAFLPAPISSAGMRVDFDAALGGGTGGDGVTLVLADPARTSGDAPGDPGIGLGQVGIPGVAIGLDTVQNPGDPGTEFLGITRGAAPSGGPEWSESALGVGPIRNQTRRVTVRVLGGIATVLVDGKVVLVTSMALPPQVLVGFTGGTGALADRQIISRVRVHADCGASAWQCNGTAVTSTGTVRLTPAIPRVAGSIFPTTAVPTDGLRASYEASISGGTGADGLAMVLADPDGGALPSSLGIGGGGIGFSGIPGLTVVLDTLKNPEDPSGNFVGVSEAPTFSGADSLTWVGTAEAPPLLGVLRRVSVAVDGDRVRVWIDGALLLDVRAAVPQYAFVGFSAGTGELTNVHRVTNARVVYG